MAKTEELDTEREQPVSLEAERTILGAIFINNEYFFDDIADLNAEDFALQAHRIVFRVMNDILFGLVEGVKQVDIVTVAEELNRRRQLSNVGGTAWLASLTEGLPRRLSCLEYVQIVKDKAKLRRIINICSVTTTRCMDQAEKSERIMSDIQNDLLAEDAEGEGKAVRIGEVTPEVEADIETGRQIATEKTHLELTWGIEKLDGFTKGAFAGEMTVLAGESGGGKTAAAVQMTLANAREDIPVAWFSVEMPKRKLVRRFYPQMGNVITAEMMRDPRLMNLHTHVPEMQRLSRELQGLPIWIDDTSALPINKLIARVRMMRRKLGIRLFVVDYFQLLVPNQSRSGTEGFVGMAYALRDLVKAEPDCHLLVLSQYSKPQGFSKKTKRTRGDLYGTQTLHHAAQNVILITVESPEKKETGDLLDAEFNVDKQRDGRKGKITTMFDRDHLLYTEPQPPLRT